ncbi:unnamed protein product (macronuclear) [Paramecium tetraurelia]|uniref:Uncharacterized protein n=1 Tax=Paramecium tetraurelia TaxID=5888 RepID=A0E1I5_PARTE|nr:uncharacterized protein GSPATT00022321001 [Paramecium tetraurelia]CAK89152.1 unnamed protein product [Paramecium tetraurelia]|eukprot:XP_001456549.1 hypothetical protein (macronuclear) [Paramecium tetraurelia strain d4-2]
MEIPSISQTRLSSKKLSQRMRVDRQGHPILKGYKLHSVTFIDNVLSGSNIHKIHLVDSWKQHNFNEFQYKNNQRCCQIS